MDKIYFLSILYSQTVYILNLECLIFVLGRKYPNIDKLFALKSANNKIQL